MKITLADGRQMAGQMLAFDKVRILNLLQGCADNGSST